MKRFFLLLALVASLAVTAQPLPGKDSTAARDSAITIADTELFISRAHIDSVYEFLINNLSAKKYMESVQVIDAAFNRLYQVAYAEYIRKRKSRKPAK